MRWALVILVLTMAADVWYRAHTFAPDVRASTGVDLWPRATGDSEPLDCDEAAYAYMGHRVLRGDALYRDLTEYKPPLGYWIYTLAVAIGGYEELAIRLMAMPFVLATIALVWWIGLRLGGPIAACLAAGLYLLLSSDPYLFGNGSNLEHFMNLFSTLSLAMILRGWERDDRRWHAAAGVCLGASALVKQVALLHAPVFVVALMLRAWWVEGREPRRAVRGLLDGLAFGLSLVAAIGLAAGIIVARGAGRAAYEDIVLQARALATDTLPEPNAPPPAIRWLTGNADPKGELPWPFGSTDYLVWWGTGSWPLWAASAPALIYLAITGTIRRRLLVAWSLSAWLQVVLPGLYWQHYYLLPVPGVAIAVAIALGDTVASVARSFRGQGGRRFPAALGLIALVVAIGWTTVLQVRYYLLVPPRELTIRYKGGRQWVVLRDLGRDIARRTDDWGNPHLYVWGWQSPLNFYSRLDSPTRHFFVDNLLRDQAGRDHPLIGPRVAEIMATLRDRPPELVFTGYPPFPALRVFLDGHYLPSPRVRGLFIRRGEFGRFETAADPSAGRPDADG